MRLIKAFTATLATLALMLGILALASPAQAKVGVQPTPNTPYAYSNTLRISEVHNSSTIQRGWDTLDYVFNTQPKTMKSLLKVSDRVSYVGTSKQGVSMLPLVSFRGKDARGFAVNHVFVFTKANKGNTIPAYQFDRLAKALPSCKTEGQNLCDWNAKKAGNKKGKSYIAVNDFTVLYRGK